MMQARKGRLLYRLIFSHLMVAVAPALLLGISTVKTNRDALLLEAQNLHLATAARLRDAIIASIELKSAALRDAERILAEGDMSFERRKMLLRAMVASGRLSAIGVYTLNGRLDSEVLGHGVRSKGQVISFPTKIRPTTKTQVTPRDGGLLVVLPWMRDGARFGHLATMISIDTQVSLARQLAERYLGETGHVAVVDRHLNYVISTLEKSGKASSKTAFYGFEVADEGELLSVAEAGVSTFFPTDSGRWLGAVVSAPAQGWLVSASRPERVALASIYTVRDRVAGFATLAALVAGLIGLWLARHITDPLRRLMRAIAKAGGEGFVKPLEVRADAEVGQLRDVFNYALDELARSRAELRHRTQLRLKMARFLPPTILHQLLTSESDVVSGGEPAVVSLLYVDIVGARSVAGEHQRLVSLLSELFVVACASVEELAGRVDHFSGDAVIGIFNNADDALRAATMALGRCQQVLHRWGAASGGQRVAVSAGLATGEAIVGIVDSAEEISVVGDVVERAAALQQSAEPGSLMMDAPTYELAGDLVAESHVQARALVIQGGTKEQVMLLRMEGSSSDG